jgi:hypothetical protein
MARLRRLSAAIVLLIGSATALGAETRTQRVEVNLAERTGSIRYLLGVNNGPISQGFTLDLSEYFRELKIPQVRLHAPNFPGQDCIHIQHIFPDMSADPDNPANYDFKLSDRYIAAIRAVGAETVFQIGWGYDIHLVREAMAGKFKDTKSNLPPADFQKFARICANVVRHYNHGWANGHQWNIRYWEIWNEPNLQTFWLGTPEQYFDLYEVVTAALKQADPAVKVGGPAISGVEANQFLEAFLARCQARSLPLDFCSWHSYGDKHASALDHARYVKGLLAKHGFTRTETHINEWSPSFEPMANWLGKPARMRDFFTRVSSREGGAYNVSYLVFMQDAGIDALDFYSLDTGAFSPIDRYGAPKPAYFAFKAFSLFHDTLVRAKAEGSQLETGFAVLAGLAPDASRANILLSNYRGTHDVAEVHITGFPWRGPVEVRQHIAEDDQVRIAPVETVYSAGTLVARVKNPAHSVVVLELVPAASQ